MPATCEVCGQANRKARAVPLDGHIRDEDGRVVGWRMEPVPAAPKRTTITCPVCGKRRRVPSPSVHQFDQITVVATGYGDWFDKTTEVPAGIWVCWHHKALKVVDDGNATNS